MAPLDRPIRIGTDCSGMETPVMALRALKERDGFWQGAAIRILHGGPPKCCTLALDFFSWQGMNEQLTWQIIGNSEKGLVCDLGPEEDCFLRDLLFQVGIY